MTLADPFFLLFAGLTVIGAFFAVSLRNVFYNALSLIVCLFGVAGLFIFLHSEFLAVMEVIIYIGAISVAIIFAIMLTRHLSGEDSVSSPAKILRAAFGAILLASAVGRAVFTTRWPSNDTTANYSIPALGKALLSTYLLPFETVSVVLLVAIIGALVLSAKDESQ